MKSKIILTFDLEFWYNSKFLRKYYDKNNNKKDHPEIIIDKILSFLSDNKCQATFFILGELAEKYPESIKKIYQQGHEIASHSYSHKYLDELNEFEIDEEIRLSKKILENIIKQKITGYRAPSFSLNRKSWLVLEILKKNGFQYDSSIHPFKLLTFQNILPEIYTTLGGFYFRFLPLWLFILLIKLLSRTKLPVIYFHPHELFESSPQIKSASWLKRKIKYFGTKKALIKFEKLLKRFNFISIKQYLLDYYN